MSETPEKKPDEIAATAQKAAGVLMAELPGQAGTLTEDEKLWGMLGHLSAFVSMLGLPGVLGPFVVYLMKKDESRFIHFHALQSIFFHLALLIAGVVLAIPLTILVLISGGLLIFPLIGLAVLLGVGMLVYIAIMGVKAKEGKWVMYPYVGKMAYEKVMAAPEKKPAESTPPTPPTTPPSNPA